MSEENPNYKQLYEQLQADIDAKKAEVTENKKRQLLLDAGYSEEQASKYLSKVEGETEQEYKLSVDRLKQDIPPTKRKYAEPGTMNGRRLRPKTKDRSEVGREAVRRLKAKGKIR
ncbi:hypothetical protein ACFOZ1_07945 [Gracilibacillus marinus]|uniref:Uncharacterized protein n=1 Tax=Gracilibacillus marinus TaxID=630535 RepID=A0ABV8VXH9_9BACI